MVNDTASLDDVFFALSGKKRRSVLRHVQKEPQRLVDLAEALDVSLPALYKHIKVLERANLIHKKKIGRERFVTANLESLEPAEEWIAEYRRYWNGKFTSLERYVKTLKETK